MQVPPPQPFDYGHASPPAQVRPAEPDIRDDDLKKALYAGIRTVASDEPEIYEISDAWAKTKELSAELQAATDERNEDRGRAAFDQRAERRW